MSRASASPAGAIGSIPAELWERVMATNLTGVLNIAQRAVPA